MRGIYRTRRKGKYLSKNVIKDNTLRFIIKRELAYEVFYHRRIKAI